MTGSIIFAGRENGSDSSGSSPAFARIAFRISDDKRDSDAESFVDVVKS